MKQLVTSKTIAGAIIGLVAAVCILLGIDEKDTAAWTGIAGSIIAIYGRIDVERRKK